MAGNTSRQKYLDAEFHTKGRIFVPGSFRTDGTNDPDDVRGDGFSVVRTSAGLYTITFAEKYPELVSIVDGRAHATAATRVQTNLGFGVYDPATGTLTVSVGSEDTGALGVADVDNLWVNFIAVFQKYTALSVNRA
jgi:hypothetical protein